MVKRGLLIVLCVFLFALGGGLILSSQQIQSNKEDSFESLGWQLYYLGNYESASQEFNIYLVKDADNAHALLGLGWSELLLGNTEKSIPAFLKIFELEVSQDLEVQAYEGLGLNYYIFGRTNSSIDISTFESTEGLKKARYYFSRALEIDPDSPAYYNRKGLAEFFITRIERENQFDQAIEDFTTAIELNPSFRYSYVPLGWAYYWKAKTSPLYERDYTPAFEAFSKSLEIDPSNWKGHYGLGLTELYRGNYQKALMSFDDAGKFYESHEIDEAMGRVHYWLGYTQHNTSHFEKAVKMFEKALEKKPTDYNTLKSLGLTLLRLERYEEAMSAYQRSLDSYENSLSYAGLSYIALRSSQPDYNIALEYANKALELKPYSSFYLVQKSSSLIGLNKFEEAKSELLKAFELEPNNEEVYEGFALLFEKQQNLQESEFFMQCSSKLKTERSIVPLPLEKVKGFSECVTALEILDSFE